MSENISELINDISSVINEIKLINKKEFEIKREQYKRECYNPTVLNRIFKLLESKLIPLNEYLNDDLNEIGYGLLKSKTVETTWGQPFKICRNKISHMGEYDAYFNKIVDIERELKLLEIYFTYSKFLPVSISYYLNYKPCVGECSHYETLCKCWIIKTIISMEFYLDLNCETNISRKKIIVHKDCWCPGCNRDWPNAPIENENG